MAAQVPCSTSIWHHKSMAEQTPADEIVKNYSMQLNSSVLPTGPSGEGNAGSDALGRQCSLESHSTQCYIPRTAAAASPFLKSPKASPVVVGEKRPKVSGIGSTAAPKRSPDRCFTCKVCQQLLSGDNFYERHLQCISCQMAINSVARTMKVLHSDAKQAYVEAIQGAPQEQRAELEHFRSALHKEAEDRIFLNLAGSSTGQIAAAGSLVQTKPETSRPARRTQATPKKVTDTVFQQGKRWRSSAWGAGTQKVRASSQNVNSWPPCHGMMMLLKACEQDLDQLEGAATTDRIAGWQ